MELIVFTSVIIAKISLNKIICLNANITAL